MGVQTPSQIIDVNLWTLDGEFEPYAEGSRDKVRLFAPKSGLADFPFIVPQHAYLFKESNKRYPEQLWVEIIAYKIGLLTGVPVPPTFLAHDSKQEKSGALIEWFYGYPYSPPETYLSGGDLLTRFIKNYDREKGKQHNFSTIARISRGVYPQGWLAHWSKILLFDALIGNTDRHQENWGIILPSVAVSPAFDNGTSMGHEIIKEKFPGLDKQRYIHKGTHHMKWEISDEKSAGHLDLLQKINESYPESRAIMCNCLNFDTATLKDEIMKLTLFDTYTRLSKERAEFIFELIVLRKNSLLTQLGC